MLIQNGIRTPDGTILISAGQHDYKEHVDKNGETYMVDGGNAYCRGSHNKVEAESLYIYEGTPHGIARKRLMWGTYGINGDQPHRHIALCDMQTGHIEAVLPLGISPGRAAIMKVELSNREGE